MNTNRGARIFSGINKKLLDHEGHLRNTKQESPSCSLVSSGGFPLWLRVSRSEFSVPEIGRWIRAPLRTRLERAFLGKGVPRQPRTLSALSHFDPHGRRIGRGDARWAQHGILTEHFAVDLSDEVILAVGVAAPHLPELDGVHSHDSLLAGEGLLSAYPFNTSQSIGRAVTEGQSWPTAGGPPPAVLVQD